MSAVLHGTDDDDAWGTVVDQVEVDPQRAAVYAEGWQSWSPTTWSGLSTPPRRPAAEWEHQMRFRPGVPVAADAAQGEGLLVLDPGTGAPVRRWAAAGPAPVTAVPTVRARLEGRHVVVRSTGPVEATAHDDATEALTSYGDRLGPGAATAPPPTVWCSWYRFFETVTAADVEEAVRDLDTHDLGVDVVLVDDGWSHGFGERLQPDERFGSLPRLVDTIRSSGRRAGVWLAPFLVGADTSVAREHPEWTVGPAGRNWGQPLLGLDLTHPGVRDLLVQAVGELVSLGIDYLKLDFLYGGAVPGFRHDSDLDPVEAYRSGLALVRERVGPNVHLVACGAPMLPSVGLVDTMRVSPDTFHEGGEDGSTGLRGLMPLAARSWQQGRLWTNDPDCVVARPSYAHRERWAAAALELGGLRSFSDRVTELDDRGLAVVRELVTAGGVAGPLADDVLRTAARLARQEGER